MIFVGPTRNFMICVFNALVAGNNSLLYCYCVLQNTVRRQNSPKNFLLPEVSCQFER